MDVLCSSQTNQVTVSLFSCHCCLISNSNSWYLCCFSVIVACRLWVDWIAVPVNAASLFVQSTGIASAWSGTVLSVSKVQFQWNLWVLFSRMNMVPQEGEPVVPVSDGNLWQPCHISVYNYLRLTFNMMKLHVGCNCSDVPIKCTYTII
jgi:hypothetical protein